MPVIHTHASTPITAEQRERIKTAYGKAIMDTLESELSIPKDRTYIRYTATTDWGWNGGNF